MQERKTLAGYREKRALLVAKLKEMGVSEEQIYEMYSTLTDYMEIDVDGLRSTQFHDTAYTELEQVKAISEKNLKSAAAFLRKFAEYIAHSILPEKTNEEIDALIDDVEEMSNNPVIE